MKNTLLLLFAVFSLSACAPRDPDVLTKDDHNMIESRKGGGSKGDSGKAKLPQKVELSMGVLAEGRALQAQQILNLANTLAAAKDRVVPQGCIRALLTDSKAGEKSYQVSFNQCSSSTDAFDASFAGVSELVLQLNEQNEVQSLQYSTHPLSDSDADTNTIQVFKKNAKDNLMIRDAFSLSMKKTDSGYAVVGNSQTILQSGYMESLTATNLSIHLDGVLTPTELVAWHSEVLGQAKNLNDSSSNPQIFSISIDTQKEPGTCAYTLKFGKSVRGGILTFSENDVTMIGKNDKSKKDDKVTVSRKKSPSLESILPWDFWF